MGKHLMIMMMQRHLLKKHFFDNKVSMSDMINRCEGYVETYTLNKDDTITVLRYVPKETK